IFLGDGYEQARTMRARHPEIPLLAVTGNCDFRENDSDVKLLTLEDGRKVIYTHGHRFHVKYGIEELVDFAVGSGASVVLFGHTHEKLCRYLDGILYVNPGRAASYDGFRFATLDFKTADFKSI
ncbi:MAG: metallophosphoesterase family protein, partial [Oscillospiraceae bacterium]